MYVGEAYQDSEGREDTVAKLLGKHDYKGCEILITRGDYSPLLKRLVENLKMAKVIIVIKFCQWL